MDSGSLPAASSPKATDNAEVLSRRTFPGQGEVQEAVRVVPEGDTSAVGHMREKIPPETGDGGHIQFGPQPNTIPEAHTAPELGRQPPSKDGGAPIPLMTSIHSEAPDTLLEALQSASIVEEHRTLMGAVIEKIQYTKSELAEACTSLLTGFEVSNAIM